jgi:hypothetical protein
LNEKEMFLTEKRMFSFKKRTFPSEKRRFSFKKRTFPNEKRRFSFEKRTFLIEKGTSQNGFGNSPTEKRKSYIVLGLCLVLFE